MGIPGIAFPDAQSFVGMSFANENTLQATGI